MSSPSDWTSQSTLTLAGAADGLDVILEWSTPRDRRFADLHLRVDDPRLPFVVEAVWHGRVLLQLAFDARDLAVGMTERQVQRAALTTLLREYRQIVVKVADLRYQPGLQEEMRRHVATAGDAVVRAARTGLLDDAGRRARGKRARGADREALLIRTADAYREVVALGLWPPIEHVAKRIGYSVDHTRELVRETRKAGHLAPARRGVAGERTTEGQA